MKVFFSGVFLAAALVVGDAVFLVVFVADGLLALVMFQM
jgi:hypothetical protein